MIREAVAVHEAFSNCRLTVYAKGSYANNTNVRADSDVDVSVQCHEAMYWEESVAGAHPPSSSYVGPWSPAKLREELSTALRRKFPGQVDTTGSTAIRIHSGTARVDADVVPCFDYRYYFASGSHRDGARVFRTSGSRLVNYPVQQLANGTDKKTRTNLRYQRAVRIMKRVENAMLTAGQHTEVPSYFVECLVYNCPDVVLRRTTWTEVIRGVLVHVWQSLDGPEPAAESERWLEVNRCKFLFSPVQAWSREDGRAFVKAAWNYLGYVS
jgi:hypothetical protein